MAAMFKRPALVLCVSVILLCLISQSESRICYRRSYSFGRYTRTAFSCSGSCCGSKCCTYSSGGYYYRYSYSGFGIIPLVIIPCCWCYRRKRLRNQQARTFNATHVAVVSSNYGMNNPGFVDASPGVYPGSAQPYPTQPKPQFAAAPPAYTDVAGQPPAYSTIADYTAEKQTPPNNAQ